MKKPKLHVEHSQPRNIQRADIAPADGYALFVDGHFKTQFGEERPQKSGNRVACEASHLAVEIYDASSKSRTGEANNLKIRDVHPFKDEKGRDNFRFIVRGKTGERDAIVRSVAAKRLDKYLTKRRAEEPGGLLFAMPDGSQIISLIDQLNSALREAGIERSSFGEKYSAYSLRHFYAVNALRNGMACLRLPETWGRQFK